MKLERYVEETFNEIELTQRYLTLAGDVIAELDRQSSIVRELSITMSICNDLLLRRKFWSLPDDILPSACSGIILTNNLVLKRPDVQGKDWRVKHLDRHFNEIADDWGVAYVSLNGDPLSPGDRIENILNEKNTPKWRKPN